MNTLKTAMLLGLLSGLLIVGGRAIMGPNGLYLGLIVAAVMNAVMKYQAEESSRSSRLNMEVSGRLWARPGRSGRASGGRR